MALLPLLTNSCKDPGEKERNHEKNVLQAYIAEKNITVAPTSSGLYYIEEVQGTGLSPKRGEFVQCSYSMRILEKEVLLNTTDSAVARADSSYNVHKLYGPERFPVGNLLSGLEEGLKLMKEGGEASLIVPSELAFGATYIIVQPYTPLLINVKLEKVIPDLPGYERSLLNQYLSDHGKSIEDSTASGIYIIHLQEGIGLSPTRLDVVKASVKGSLSDGRVFLKDADLRWTLDQMRNSITTKGLHEGVDSMKIGGKARIIVPYTQGYGSYGTGGTNFVAEDIRKGPIPPYATLYYDVELAGIVF